MRRWELVSGSSAKFWEIGRDGASVTVRFGRLQTAGQTQTKELASAEAAEAHVAKLVAEKEKKGYIAVGATAATPAPAAIQPTAARPTGTPATAQPATAQPATAQPTAAQPTAAQPTTAAITAQPTATTTAQATTAQPTAAQPSGTPATAQSTAAQATTAQPTAAQPSGTPATAQSTAAQSTAAQSTAAQSTAAQSTAAQSTAAQSTAAQPASPNNTQPTTSPIPEPPHPADSPNTPTPTVDEDTWVMPKAWLRDVVRQRGFTPAPEFQLDTAKAAQARQQIADQADTIERVLSMRSSHADLVAATREHLAGRANPVGAAAIAAITSTGLASVHAWIADHGLAFAAAAVVEFMGLTCSEDWDNRRGKMIGTRLHHRRAYWMGRNEVESQMLIAARYAIAVADDAQREAAEAALAQLHVTADVRELRSFLVPWRKDWFDEVCRRHPYQSTWWLLPCSASTYEEFVKADRSLPGAAFVLYTTLYVLGPAIAPLLADGLDEENQVADSRKLALKVLAALPTDEAFTILLDRVDTKYVRPFLLNAMAAFPVRAARLLGERVETSDGVRQLLKAHLLAHPSLDVPAEVAAVLAASEERGVPEASADQLPPLLVSPPWLRRRPPVKPVVVADLAVPDPTVVWAPGERERWLDAGRDWYSDDDWKKLLEEYDAGRIGYRDNELFLLAPPEEVRHLVGEWTPNYSYGFEDWGKRIAARFEVDAVPALLRLAQATPATGGVVLLPFATAEVAAVMADWFARTKQARRWGLDWLARHRELAARLLVPAAAGKPGTARRNAEAALRHLRGSGVDVQAVAASCGAQAAIDVVLSVDPLDVLPAKLPVIGEWADTRLLPQVLLRDRVHALPAEAAGHLLMTAALSKPGEVYAGLPIARDALDRDSLAAFAWAVFEQWLQAGGPSKESWALSALGWFGDDSTVRALSPLIRAWPGESQHTRAVAGLDVLADIGTEVALSHLNSIAEKVSFKGLKTRAQEKVAQIAAELGLSRDQLSDRLVPRLGLDDAATLVIDYGPRQFTVGFDEQLKPYVLDPDGKRRKDLPKPAAKDDPAKAPLEHKRFAALKKDVRTIASDQIRRLERAMVDQRTWTAEEFHTVLAAHPLLWHLVRRLVWITDAGLSFRLAEDRTLADSQDDEITLPENATVRVAHPVDLQAEPQWGEVFADYEILQPFPQLGRPVHVLAPGENLLPRLTKFQNVPHPVGKILGLTKKGWVRGEPQDAGVECWITRPLPGGGALVASLEPGIAVGAVDEFPEISFPEMWFSPHGNGDWSAPKNAPATFEVDPITVSELLSELESLQS